MEVTMVEQGSVVVKDKCPVDEDENGRKDG